MDESYVIQKWIRVRLGDPITAHSRYYMECVDCLSRWRQWWESGNKDSETLDCQYILKPFMIEGEFGYMGIKLTVRMKPLKQDVVQPKDDEYYILDVQ